MNNLKDKLILITGGGSGLGKLMAQNFCKEDSRIILLDINIEAVNTVAKSLSGKGNQVWGYQCDVTNREKVYQLAGQIKKDIGNVDILINNAGVVTGKKFIDTSDEELLLTMNVNIISHFWMVKAFLPDMIETNKGHIVSIASAAGLIGVNNLVAYSVSKFASVGFDEALRVELKRIAPGIKTTCIAPFFINTGMFAGVKSRLNFLLPLLDQEKVAKKIVHAIKKEKVMLKLPPIVRALSLSRLLPTPIFDFVINLLGIHDSMNQFKGRDK